MKICSVENCNYPVFSGGFCRTHGYMRAGKKRKPISIHSKKKPIHEVSFGFESQLELFEYLWENAKNEKGEVICSYTGEKLNRFYGTNLFLNCFAHILPKKNWNYFKLFPDNIQIVFPDFHKIIDAGTNADRAKHPEWKWDLWDAKVLEMKTEYQNFKNENLLS